MDKPLRSAFCPLPYHFAPASASGRIQLCTKANLFERPSRAGWPFKSSKIHQADLRPGYSHLEGVLEDGFQDRLARRYAMTGTDKHLVGSGGHSGHIPKIRHQARKRVPSIHLKPLIFLRVKLEGIEPTTS